MAEKQLEGKEGDTRAHVRVAMVQDEGTLCRTVMHKAHGAGWTLFENCRVKSNASI